MLPNKLKDFNLFGDGNSWQGQIPELTIPELARTMEEYRAGGMDGKLEIDLGQEAIMFEWQAAGWVDGIVDHYGAWNHDAALLRFTGSYESDETGAGRAIEIVVRGRHKTIAMGDAKGGESNQIQVTTSCSYYKLSVDDQEVLEIDIPGNVFKVNGSDRLADRRARLGI